VAYVPDATTSGLGRTGRQCRYVGEKKKSEFKKQIKTALVFFLNKKKIEFSTTSLPFPLSKRSKITFKKFFFQQVTDKAGELRARKAERV